MRTVRRAAKSIAIATALTATVAGSAHAGSPIAPEVSRVGFDWGRVVTDVCAFPVDVSIHTALTEAQDHDDQGLTLRVRTRLRHTFTWTNTTSGHAANGVAAATETVWFHYDESGRFVGSDSAGTVGGNVRAPGGAAIRTYGGRWDTRYGDTEHGRLDDAELFPDATDCAHLEG